MFIPSFDIGSVVDHKTLFKEFRCSSRGSIRRSKNTNTLVLISDRTKPFYKDEWKNGILYYTGMGMLGDQDFNFLQNTTLFNSRTNGIGVHLFEFVRKNEYQYYGLVELCDDPYMGIQKDMKGNPRKVCIFPLVPKIVMLEDYDQKILANQAQILQLSDQELELIAREHQTDNPKVSRVVSTVINRDQYISESTKRRASGKCQLCGDDAPFLDRFGRPYLESHHVVWLSRAGGDTLDNVVALCPNCHRKMHIVDEAEDVLYLLQEIRDSSGELQ